MEIQRKQMAKDMACLISYLMWQWAHSNNLMWGGYKIEEALDACSRLTGFTREQMKQVAFGDGYEDPK